jgi:3',5'-cyclic AMP phosphodiesterase CpdA
MKKFIAAIVIVVFAFFAFQSFAQSSDSGALFSFRGVLYGILKETENIAAKVASPFVGSETAPTAPAQQNNAENSFSFAVIGDTQSFKAENPNSYFRTIVKLIAKENPDLVLSTGDLTASCESYTECLNKHNDWKKIVGPLLSKTYAAMGNHDNIDNKGMKAWQDAFDFPTNGPGGFLETVYSFDIKNSHFVFLNSDHEKEHLVNGEQRAWLDQNLARNKKENVFVFFHEPAYPTGAKISESLDKEPSERDALWQILEKHNVTAVFNGHEHIVSRRKIGGLYQFVFASTDSFDHDLPKSGVAEYSNQGQGRFGIARVNGKEITVETHDSNGAILNSFTFSK